MDNYDSILERRIQSHQSQSLILLQAQEIGGGGGVSPRNGNQGTKKRKKVKSKKAKGRKTAAN